MREYQIFRTTYRLFLITLAINCIIYQTSYGQEKNEKPFDDVKAIIRTVIPAIEALEAQLPATGRGVAKIEMENYAGWLDGKDLTVDFVFKDHNSRWDINEWIDGNLNSRLWARVVTDKYGVSLELEPEGSENVTISPARSHSDNSNDFHPITFLTFNGYTLKTRLQNSLNYDFESNPGHYVSAELDNEAILTIINGGPVTSPKDQGLVTEFQMSFDTKRAMVPFFLRNTFTSPESTNVYTVLLEWAQYGSKWYISRVEYNNEPDNIDHKIFTIKNFTPNVDVSDKEFTLDGLDIPDGILVIDRLAGLTYRYAIPVVLQENQEKPLPLDDPKAVAQTVLSAMKKIQLPKSGRGTAIMKTENYDSGLDGKDLIVNFWFKNKNSRSDIFESKDGKKGPRLKSTIVSEKHYISLSGDEVFVNRARAHSDYGRDFHPEVFMAFKNRQLTKNLVSYIENFERPGINRSVELDSKEILHIIAQGHVVMPERGDEYDHKYHFSFDTNKGLLPVYYSSAMRHEPNDWGSTQARLEWTKYKSDWYVSRIEYGMKPKDTDHRIVTIKDFRPNIEISDEEFTLDGMDIPDGFLVVDRVSGLQYRYVKPDKKTKIP